MDGVNFHKNANNIGSNPNVNPTSNVDVISMIMYIKQRVNDLTDNERKEIYQIIGSSDIDDSKVQEKGDGILIKFKDIPQSVIKSMYVYMVKKISEKQEQLNNCTEENEIDDD